MDTLTAAQEQQILSKVAAELKIKDDKVIATAKLLSEDATVPFIARYRKEVTGNLDEVAIIAIRDRIEQLRELETRREVILQSLKDQEKLTPELEAEVKKAETMSKLEDIYLPYRPKRRTRATIAKEKGLEPLAELIFALKPYNADEVAKYIDTEKGVPSAEEALQGARDIMAEWINENAEARENMRKLFVEESSLVSKVIKGKEEEGAKYRDYFDWTEPMSQAPSHRVLAVLRAVEEGIISCHVLPEEEKAVNMLKGKFVKEKNNAAEQVALAVTDSYARLLCPSMENEMLTFYKKKADEEAIRVFSENIRELLLASPLGEKPVLALDPGLRTGCKLVCLTAQGALVHYEAIYPLEPHNKKDESAKIIKALCEKYRIEAVAVGNGTGGREATAFCKSLDLGCPIVMVNESGASVYSASDVARKEFPDHDVTVRGAVSIGRRLMDPLAELIKIDPKAIGVGQYQHDVDQRELKKSLDDVVLSCVNAVGVEVNTASERLLSYVSGLTSRAAAGIVNYRDKIGPFKTRDDLKNVPGIGPKAFEQAAGFLRIREAQNPLDSSAVHPESYPVVEKMAQDLACSVNDLIKNSEIRAKIALDKYVSEKTGMPTLKDIMQELAKPGRDPRKEFEVFSFADGVKEISDVKPGMKLTGIVTNVTAFGAFVDIGVHQDGLVHISHLSDNYVSNPHNVVKVQQKVDVTVLEVDIPRKRISLSMKKNVDAASAAATEKETRTAPKAKQKPQDKAKKPARNTNEEPKKYSHFAELADKFSSKK